MIPHRLNLLSSNKYQNLKHMVSFQFIKNLLEIILIILSLGGIVLLGGQWILQDYFSQIAQQIVLVSNHYAETNQEIKKINFTLNQVEKIQKEYESPTVFLISLTEKIPQGVILSTLVVNNKKITLTGTADTRENLLLFRDNLNTLKSLKPVEIPPSQLTEKNNIQFSLILERR